MSTTDEVQFNVYSLQFKNYHEKVGQIDKSGTLKLEKGSYKIEGVDEDRTYQKVVLLDNNMTVYMDFAERYGEIDIRKAPGFKKAVMAAFIIGAIFSLIMYLIGFDVLSEYITL